MDLWGFLGELFSLNAQSRLLVSAVLYVVPIALGALGAMFSERAGVLNLSIEGTMLVGALAGFALAYLTGSGWIGLLAGLLFGALFNLIMAYLSITLRTDQVVNGIALVLLGQGLTFFFYRVGFGVQSDLRISGLSLPPIPVLKDIPLIGNALFGEGIFILVVVVIVALSWVVLFQTTFGLRLRAVGENPAAADAAGVNVNRTRYAAVLICGALAGLGGAALVVANLKFFNDNVTAGQGWIAVALVIFARWQPVWCLVGAIFFGYLTALSFYVQGRSSQLGGVPFEFFLMLPYVVTLLALVVGRSRAAAPAALGTAYVKESK